ncbi:MAG: hypothetical protein AB1416_11395, partial [Actinomycetota bacterium]
MRVLRRLLIPTLAAAGLLAVPATGAATFAVVGADGTILQGVDVVSATAVGIGQWEVRFNKDVKGCVYTATILAPAKGIAATQPSLGSDNQVRVETGTSTSGAAWVPETLPFQVDVHCGGDGLWAAINADSSTNRTFARQSGGIIASGGGAVEVQYPQGVTNCAWLQTATGVPPGNSGPLVSAGKTATALSTNVRVETKNLAFGVVNTTPWPPFQTWVMCLQDRLWGVVQADGGLRRGAGVTGTSHPSGGVYEVAFSRDVTNCATTASISDPGDLTYVYAPALIAASRSDSNPNAVRVEIRETPFGNPATPPTDRPFHVALDCGPAPTPPPAPPPPP